MINEFSDVIIINMTKIHSDI